MSSIHLAESGDIKASVAVLSFIFSSAAKHDVDSESLSSELQQLGLPKGWSTRGFRSLVEKGGIWIGIFCGHICTDVYFCGRNKDTLAVESKDIKTKPDRFIKQLVKYISALNRHHGANIRGLPD